MRMGSVIALVVLVVIAIGGVAWYVGTAPEEPVPDLSPEAGDTVGLPPADTADVEPAEAPPAEPDGVPSEAPAPAGQDGTEAAAADQPAEAEDGAIVVGDEIPEDAIVVESATDEPVILDAETANPTILATEAETPATGAPDTAADTDATEENAATADAADGTAGAAPADQTGTAPAPAELLTPENFDPDAVFNLIAKAEQLSTQQRSSLRALVEGASVNPDLRRATIDALREALNLPPLQ